MSYSIKRQETTGLWVVVDDSTGKNVSRAERPSDAVNLAKEKGISSFELDGLVASAESQDAAETNARAEQQSAASSSTPAATESTGGTPYKESVAFQQAPSGSLAGDTGYNSQTNDGEWQAVPNNKLYGSDTNLTQNEFLSNPRDARLANAGLYNGGANSPASADQVPDIQQGASDTGGVPTEQDWRVRISLPPGNTTLYRELGSDRKFMEPLVASGIMGVVFPYTPTITLAYNARYAEQALTHSNFKSYFYEGSDIQPITISGEFTAQNQAEAQYVLACVYFLRAATKMLWGNDENAGAPPPILKLNGFGKNYFPDVSCVLTNFTHTMSGDVDYIAIMKSPYDGVRIPVISTISVTLQPVYSREKIATYFDVRSYGRAGGYSGSRFL